MTIQWDDNLLTGIEELDNQHKELFQKVIQLFNACQKGKGREEVVKTFAFLEDYVLKHFKTEESIMYKYRYPLHISHIAEHQQFNSVVLILKEELQEHGATGQFVVNTNRKIVQWLVSHIGKEDKVLAKYIREKS